MSKFVALVLVLGAVSNCILTITEAYENRKNSGGFTSNDEITSVKDDLNRGRYEKKYHKEREKRNFHPDKESHYKQDKYWDAERKFSSDHKFNEFEKNGKFSKYDNHVNSHGDPSKTKDVNYHDKIGPYEKHESHMEGRKEQEIFDDDEEKHISLHHDIDVNYLDHQNALPTDAEVIDIGEMVKNHKKKDNMKNLTIKEKKEKENFYRDLKEIDLTSIPSSNNSALIARYIIHNVDWTVLGTLSTNSKIKGGPFVNVISVSDGPVNKGSGVPFFYMTPKDFSSMDLEKDNRCCIIVTLAQTDFCTKEKLDPESPLCARLILSGKVKKVKPHSEEEHFAKLALFSRHPEMKSWPADHDWFFSKLKIKQIILINHFGGASYVSIQDYFNADNI